MNYVETPKIKFLKILEKLSRDEYNVIYQGEEGSGINIIFKYKITSTENLISSDETSENKELLKVKVETNNKRYFWFVSTELIKRKNSEREKIAMALVDARRQLSSFMDTLRQYLSAINNCTFFEIENTYIVRDNNGGRSGLSNAIDW